MKAWHAPRILWLEAAALLAAAFLAAMLAAPAFGQRGSAPCSPSQPPGSPGTTTGSGEQDKSQPREDLSDRLARSDGTICPPAAVDPEIHLPAPETGKMPVIPPPGSPGGDQNVRPR